MREKTTIEHLQCTRISIVFRWWMHN